MIENGILTGLLGAQAAQQAQNALDNNHLCVIPINAKNGLAIEVRQETIPVKIVHKLRTYSSQLLSCFALLACAIASIVSLFALNAFKTQKLVIRSEDLYGLMPM